MLKLQRRVKLAAASDSAQAAGSGTAAVVQDVEAALSGAAKSERQAKYGTYVAMLGKPTLPK